MLCVTPLLSKKKSIFTIDTLVLEVQITSKLLWGCFLYTLDEDLSCDCKLIFCHFELDDSFVLLAFEVGDVDFHDKALKGSSATLSPLLKV